MGLLLPTTTSVIKQAHQQEVSDCNEMLDEIYVSKKQALVLGTPGSGKTTFLQTLKFLYSRGETFLLLLSSSLDKKSHMAKLPKEVLFIIASIYLQIPDNPSSVEEVCAWPSVTWIPHLPSFFSAKFLYPEASSISCLFNTNKFVLSLLKFNLSSLWCLSS
eukprot:TRINITY_DN5010_c0_g2_i1.p1 TRINITY_DN5010_c0_g2~~TRINITY_DN5010_c0_g2_i1.p1  ORF type:complete len:161 (+),score=19.61 TRINITY_DN5010_c0_g2_i1:117-599(+)